MKKIVILVLTLGFITSTAFAALIYIDFQDNSDTCLGPSGTNPQGWLIQFTCAGANGVIDLPNADGSPSGDDYLPTGNVGYEYTIDNFGMPGSLWTDALVTQDVTQTDPYANVGDGLYIRMFNATTIASADQHCDAPLSGAYIITIAQFQTVEVGNDWAAWQSFGGTAPEPPVATAATTNGTLTFFANWNASTDATGYYLDVATDASFTTYLTGFENLDVGNVLTYSVTAEAAIEHYYRLRAYNAYGTSSNSNVIVVSGSTLPVELSSFTVQFTESSPILCWTTQSETGNAGWNVYRGDYRDAFINGDAIQINPELIEGAGTTTIPTNYTFEDQYNIIAGDEYWYILESVDYSGETQIHGSVSLIIPEENTTPELPQQTVLMVNYPNPFNPNTTIGFMVKENETAHLSIFNLKGQKLESISFEAGIYNYFWDASDFASGIYLYKLKSESFSEIRKMILLK